MIHDFFVWWWNCVMLTIIERLKAWWCALTSRAWWANVGWWWWDHLPKHQARPHAEWMRVNFDPPLELDEGEHVLEVPSRPEPGDDIRIDGEEYGPIEWVADRHGNVRGPIFLETRRDDGYGAPGEWVDPANGV